MMRPTRVVLWVLTASLISACSSGGGGALPTREVENAVQPEAPAVANGGGIAGTYTLTDLGSGISGSPGLAVTDLNIWGEVALEASSSPLGSLPSCGLPNQLPCGPPVGLLYRSGSLHVLPPLRKGQTTFANAINNDGVVGGGSADAVTEYATLWKRDLSAVDFGSGITPPNSGAEIDALDNEGRVYGDSFNATVDIPITFDSDNDSKPIAPCGSGVLGYFRSSNSRGVGVGDEILAAGGTAAMTCPAFRVIASPPNPKWLNFGFGIDNSGEVVGRLSVGPNIKIFHPFIYFDGKITDLGTPLYPGNPSAVGAAFGINNAGTVVGWSAAGGGVIGPPRILPINPKAWIYCGRRLVDLNTLLPKNIAKEWTLIIADKINDHGQIAGIAYKGGYPNGVEHAVLLTPQ